MKNEKKLLFATVFVISLLYLFSLNSLQYLGNSDSGQYLTISKSLVEKQGYYDLSSPSDTPLSSTLTLPFYPLLLSPVFLFADGSFFVARLISAIFGIASLFVFYYIAKEFFDSKESLFIMAIVGLSPLMMIYSRTILTEVPYTFLSLLALLLLHKSRESKFDNIFIAGGFFVLLASLTKGFGIILLASSIAYFAMKRNYKKAAYFILIIAGFIVVAYLIKYYFLYTQPFPAKAYQPAKVSGRLISNITEYLFYFIPMNLVTPMLFLVKVFSKGTYLYFIGFFISLIIGIGFVKQIRESMNIFHIYTLIFTAFIVLTRGVSGNGRYMMPILLFFMIYFLDGLKYIVFKTNTVKLSLPSKNGLFIAILLVLISSSFFGGVLLSKTSHYKEMPAAWENYFKATEWITAHSLEDDIIMTARHNDFYLYSNRKVVPPSRDSEDTMEQIERYNVKYVMETSTRGSSQEALISSAVSKNIDNFELVYSTESPVARVYAVKISQEN